MEVLGIKKEKIELLIEQDDSLTKVRASTLIEGKEYVGKGMARRKKTDPVIPQIGYELALSRALLALGNAIGESAQMKVQKYLPKSKP